MESTRLIERFSPYTSLRDIREASIVKPNPVCGLETMSANMASASLVDTLRAIYIPSESACALIGELLEIALRHSTASYPSSDAYLRGIYSGEYSDVFPLCLSGVAGVGKSQLIKALWRLMPVDGTFDPGPGVSDLAFTSMWEINVKDKKGIIPMLTKFLPPEKQGENRRKTVDQVLAYCRKKAFREGVSLLVADEFQFYTSGDASAKLAEALLNLSTLGVPMLYVANYSMLQKLLGRPQQDRQRLMVNPRILLPDLLGDESWRVYVEECVRVSSGSINIEIDAFCETLHVYTAGIKRLCILLLGIAYKHSRARGVVHIGLHDLKSAYQSTEYAVNRVDVEIICRQNITGKSGRADLWCPLALPQSTALAFTASSEKKRDEVVSEQLVRASLTLKEKNAVKALEGSHVKKSVNSGDVIKLREPRKAPTVESLTASLQRLIERDK